MDGRCETCRWWTHANARDNDPDDRSRDCGLARVRHGNRPDHPESKAKAWDLESYMAGLSTARDFGCVQWQARDDGDGQGRP